MARRNDVVGILAALVAMIIGERIATAQPAPPALNEAAATDKSAEARVHFEKGLKLLDEGIWDAALAEFLQSRLLFPTRSATNNAAICMRKLNRFDEALDLFEALLREFPDLPADVKASAQRAMVELGELVGTVEIKGSEPGAAIVIDGRNRGEFPVLTPIRVSAGSHLVRVYKEGFEPFEARVEVAGGQTARTVARLSALAESGRLRVTEKSGKVLDVVVDSVVVGKTPWEGRLSVGAHQVVLRGEGNQGTQPVSAPVRLQQVTALTLTVEELTASIRIEPTPAGASVAIDSVTVGQGIWEGRLRDGAHLVEVAAEGFVAVRRQVSLERGEQEVVSVALQRDADSPLWRKPARFMLEIDGAMPLTPSFGGEVAGNCGDQCSRDVGFGGYGVFRAGYEFGSGFGFGVTAGYLLLRQATTGRQTTIQPVGLDSGPGMADDTLTFQGFLAGIFAGLSFGERYPLHLRLGGGVLIGSIADQRSGTFQARDGSTYGVAPVRDAPSATFFHVGPEVRLGIRVTDDLELTAGVEGLLLIALNEPMWDPRLQVDASTDGFGVFTDSAALTGPIVVAIAPGLGARYDF